jgi:RNA recognition motif-containing protein
MLYSSNTSSLQQIQQRQKNVYDQVESMMSTTFARMAQTLVEQQLQFKVNMNQIRRETEKINSVQKSIPPQIICVIEQKFETNTRELHQKLECLRINAFQLTNIKAVLESMDQLVAKDGILAKLVPHVSQVVEIEHSTFSSACPFTSGFAQPAVALDHTLIPEYKRDRDWLATTISRRISLEPATRTLAATLPVPKASCFVFYLPPTVTEEKLRDLFSPYGTILKASIGQSY